ncbi:MAG: hypothetical protein J7M21_02920, partial [Planctomycetes bacterium]|nr:hypothetical protein [Planctomycetota bacterium]
MFFALLTGAIEADGLEIEPVAAELVALNDRASRGELEVTMISAAAYPYLRDRYVLARCGTCLAAGHGPMLVAREPIGEKKLSAASVAVPDTTGSATVALQLSRPGIRTRLLPADKIIQATRIGLADCALLACGDRGTCRQSGLYCVEDLAAGWARQTGQLPLPLTVVAIRADLPQEMRVRLEGLVRRSIRYGLDHRAAAERFAARAARTTRPDEVAAPLGAYVSETSLAMDATVRSAIEELLRRGRDARLLPDA